MDPGRGHYGGPGSAGHFGFGNGPSNPPHTYGAAGGGISGHMNSGGHPGGMAANEGSASRGSGPNPQPLSDSELHQLIPAILDPETRDRALQELGKKRDAVVNLAPTLWYAFGVVTALLQEIVSLYTLLNPPTLTVEQSIRGCNALALLQCLAMHQDTREPFLKANIPVYLYPFLKSTDQAKPFEYLKLTSLGVIGALVKTDEKTVVHFLLNTEIIPLCLQIMESGSDLSKTVATFILQKILTDDIGLEYICHTYERFVLVADALEKTVKDSPSARQLKHIIRCYQRLCEFPRAKDMLASKLPPILSKKSIAETAKEDPTTLKWYEQLLELLEGVAVRAAQVPVNR